MGYRFIAWDLDGALKCGGRLKVPGGGGGIGGGGDGEGWHGRVGVEGRSQSYRVSSGTMYLKPKRFADKVTVLSV